ncbi:MAG: type II toxin-antitoxin system VapC family toxin [Gemmatimonadota bacterium]
MRGVLVDSDVLLDVLTEDDRWFEWSSDAITRLGEDRLLVINPIIYSELSLAFRRIEDLDAAIPPSIRREPLPWPTAFLAGRCREASRRRGEPVREADLYIGAHAAIRGYTLLTRHPAPYAARFPALELHAPAPAPAPAEPGPDAATAAPAESAALRQLGLSLGLPA